MSRNVKVCLAFCLFLFVIPKLDAQTDLDTIDKLVYDFDLGLLKNLSEDMQAAGSKLASFSNTLKDPNTQVRNFNTQSKLKIHLEDANQAKMYFEKADSVYQANPEKISLRNLSDTYYAKSMYASFVGETDLEESYLDSCLITLLPKEPSDIPIIGLYNQDVATVYQKLCYIYFGKGQVMKSIDYMRMAEVEMDQIQMMTELDSLILGNIYNDIAYLQGSIGNNEIRRRS